MTPGSEPGVSEWSAHCLVGNYGAIRAELIETVLLNLVGEGTGGEVQ